MATRFALLTLALSVSTLEAQSYWNDDRERQESRLEFLHPIIAHAHLKPLSGASFFGVSGRIGSGARLEAELPLAIGGQSGGPSAVLVGNPYFGLRSQQSSKALTVQLGVRLPVRNEVSSSEDETAIGAAVLSDADRMEAFFEKVLTARFALEWRAAGAGNFLGGAKLGASVFFPSDGGGDAEAFFDYGGRIGVQGSSTRVTLALTGRLFATAGGGSFAQLTEQQVSATLELVRGPIRPGALLRVPLDESNASAIIGVRVVLVP
ncbi:MAG TPA: hypothetical protein VGP61_07145 [Gemmatimonadales bacterium]|nr:hypothetical protein [Gemmatimonadales bacterium]